MVKSAAKIFLKMKINILFILKLQFIKLLKYFDENNLKVENFYIKHLLTHKKT